MRGYVYILSNPAMPGILKIGRSVNGGRRRATDIDGTGVPMPFHLVFEIFTDDCEFVEKAVHERLAEDRVNASREFFKVEESDAIRAVAEEALCFFDFNVCHTSEYEAFEMCVKLAMRIKSMYSHPMLMISALEFLELEHIENAMRKYNAWMEKRLAETRLKEMQKRA